MNFFFFFFFFLPLKIERDGSGGQGSPKGSSIATASKFINSEASGGSADDRKGVLCVSLKNDCFRLYHENIYNSSLLLHIYSLFHFGLLFFFTTFFLETQINKI